MPNVEEILSKKKSMVIAPAGYGKTHFITTCISGADSKQLILTHTHAGVASLRQKLKRNNINPSMYNVETITSFAQKYVFAYSDPTQLPNQEDSKRYYPYIIEKATGIFTSPQIKRVLRATYSMFFVDEYQDCSEDQHQLILSLAEVLNVCILGDPLQGIFDFSTKNPIDLTDRDYFKYFADNQYELTIPWRWKNNGSEDLGSNLHKIRQEIIKRDSIDLRKYKSIEVTISQDPYRECYSKIMKIITDNDSLLIIIPDSKSINKRLDFQRRFLNRTVFLEAIDGKDFYTLAKKCDQVLTSGSFSIILELMKKVFNKTAIDNWFNGSDVKNKKKQEDKEIIQPIKDRLNTFFSTKKPIDLVHFLSLTSDLSDIKCYRRDLLYSIIDSLESSQNSQQTVYHAMMEKRNIIRRVGRSVNKKCIGTTLLTKGLEFDTVLIMNCHEFNCRRNFYVAATRASKKLHVITKNPILNFQ